MISDRQHAQNEDERLRLESRGFRFHIKPTEWTVFFGERQVGHGECSADQRGLHYAHARASRRAALEDAIRCARQVRL